MTKDELSNLEDLLAQLVVRRRLLGGFDTNAEAIYALAISLLALTQHVAKRTQSQIEQKMAETEERIRNQK